MNTQKEKFGSLVEKTIATKLWSQNFSFASVYAQIFFTSSFFGFGLWKLHNDFANVFLMHTQNLNLWMEIVQNVELLICLLGTVATTAENIIELRFQERKKAFLLFIQHSMVPVGESNLLFFFAVFYAFFLVSKIIWHFMGSDDSDNYSFLLKITGECFLIGAKLKFSSVVLQVQKCFEILNENLAEALRSTGNVEIWYSKIERGRFEKKITIHNCRPFRSSNFALVNCTLSTPVT